MAWQTITTQAAWADLVTQFSDLNFLHAWQWGEWQRQVGRTVIRRGLAEQAGYTAAVIAARRARYLTIQGGPLVDWHDRQAVTSTFADLRDIGRQHNCAFVRFRPQAPRQTASQQLLTQLGARPAPMHLGVEQAGLLDLNQPVEVLVKQMSQSLRRKLRQAERAGVEVVATKQPAALAEFCRLHRAHATRTGYVPFVSKHLQAQFTAFAQANLALIYHAQAKGETLAMNMIFFYGSEAAYHYGVSTPAGQRLPSAPALHLAAIKEAQDRGLARYNFWGVVDPEQTKHRFFGPSQFKRSFGIYDYHYLPSSDLIIKPLVYWPNWLFETARRRRRRL